MDYWQKQTNDKPLFEDILWSRPETKQGAGKLLVIGGNSFGFASTQQAYGSADKAGVGIARTLLPVSLQKTVGSLLENTSFAPNTPSGSFAKDALNELLINSQWADGVIISGDLGRNSETSILLENYLTKYSGLLTLTKDAVDYFYNQPNLILDRENTLLVISLGQLQKLATAAKFQTPFILGMGLMLLVQALHEFTSRHPVTIITKELDNIVVAHGGKVSSTRLTTDKEIWRVDTAARASVFWLQNPNKPYESIASSFIHTNK